MIRRATIAAVLMLTGLTIQGCKSKAKAIPQVEVNGRVWLVDVADTLASRGRGLGGRTALSHGAGMLFVYPQPQVLQFCMRDCHIPLDIAFIGADRRVIATYTMQVEADRQGRVIYTSEVPAQYALEVNAGLLAQAGVREGDLVTFKGPVDPTKAQAGP